jgi:hypothetical protein
MRDVSREKHEYAFASRVYAAWRSLMRSRACVRARASLPFLCFFSRLLSGSANPLLRRVEMGTVSTSECSPSLLFFFISNKQVKLEV